MDATTVKHYTDTAPERCAAYEGVDVSATHELMLRHFGKEGRFLEIGCGSGRDAAFLTGNPELWRHQILAELIRREAVLR